MKITKRKINLCISIVIIIVFSIIFFNMNEGFMTKDDEIYSQVFYDLSSFKDWVFNFYTTWSGRIVTSALSNIFLRMPLVIFKIANTIVYVIAILSITKIVNKICNVDNLRFKNILLFFTFLISLIINKEVYQWGAIWVTGAFNYLWPTAFMIFSLIPFIKSEDTKNIYFIFYILSDFIACFAEQTALVLVCFATISLIISIINRKKLSKALILHYIIIVILTIIEIFAPGNSVRAQASMLRRYPTFNMLNVGDKLLQGIIVIANQLLTADIKLMLILTLLIGIYGIMNKKQKLTFKILSIIPFVYFGSSYICNKIGIFEGILYNLPNFGKEYIYGIKIYIPIIIFILNLVLIACTTLFSFESERKNILTDLIYLASIMSSLSISFSPTIFASGSRIFFVMDFLLIAVIGIFLGEIFRKENVNKLLKWLN